MNAKLLTGLGALVVLAAVLGSWWLLQRSSDRAVWTPPAHDPAALRPEQAYGGRGDGPARAAIHDAVAERVVTLRRDAGMTPAEVAVLGERAGELADIYRSGNEDAFAAFLGRVGMEPRPGVAPDWAQATAAVRDAPFDPANTRVVVRVHEGNATADPFSFSFTSTRTGGTAPPDPQLDPLANRLTAVEVLVPMRMVDSHGDPFDGHLGMMFVKRPTDGEWVLISAAVYEVPLGRRVNFLPV